MKIRSDVVTSEVMRENDLHLFSYVWRIVWRIKRISLKTSSQNVRISFFQKIIDQRSRAFQRNDLSRACLLASVNFLEFWQYELVHTYTYIIKKEEKDIFQRIHYTHLQLYWGRKSWVVPSPQKISEVNIIQTKI